MDQPYIYWRPDFIADYSVNMRGVLHIGAHVGQEYDDYMKYGIKNIIFFEPVVSTYTKLLETIPQSDNVKIINLALGNTTGEIDMFIETANQGMSSSILEAGTHLTSYPQITFDTKETVKIDKLDNVEFDRSLYNTINLDVQGYELEVLKGAVETLKHIDVIFSEVNMGEVYKGCAKLGDIDEFLKQYNFTRVHTHIYEDVFYGDAIYIRQ
jgi:FkbM family methyltransferase